MPTQEVIDLLKDVPLFNELSEKHLKSVVKTAKEKSFDEETPIVRQGQQQNVGFYLILEGQVEVRKSDKVLSTLGSGQFFGEMSALDGQPRSADVIATTDTKCLMLTNWNLKSLIKTYPDIATSIIAELTRRLRQTNMALSK